MMKFEELPRFVKSRMLDNQKNQGNRRNPDVFVKDIHASRNNNGFNWDTSKEGSIVWSELLEFNNILPFLNIYKNVIEGLLEVDISNYHNKRISFKYEFSMQRPLKMEVFKGMNFILRSLFENNNLECEIFTEHCYQRKPIVFDIKRELIDFISKYLKKIERETIIIKFTMNGNDTTIDKKITSLASAYNGEFVGTGTPNHLDTLKTKHVDPTLRVIGISEHVQVEKLIQDIDSFETEKKETKEEFIKRIKENLEEPRLPDESYKKGSHIKLEELIPQSIRLKRDKRAILLTTINEEIKWKKKRKDYFGK